MKLFASYLRKNARSIFFLLGSFLIFAGVFSLYHLPLDAIGYAAALCAALGLLLFCTGFISYARRIRTLTALERRVMLSLDELPPPCEELEAEYQDLLHLVFSEMNRSGARYDMLRRDMVDYYTLWAHQIKTPISAMHLLLQERGAVDRDAVEMELFEVEQYVEMVLSYLRVDCDSSDFVLKDYALDEIIRQCLRKYARSFILKKISLNFQPTNLKVLTDEKWLAFVIEQLLSNALKYTPSGSVAIRAEGRQLIVSDTGIGIRPEDLPRVFEKGYTGYNGRADKKATGIGLYLCRRVCQKLGHTICIASKPGEGTTVTVDLGREKRNLE